ncbi:hypothetical protein J3E72DRAFT_285881, partial [Bipolaris maydis]
MPPKKTTTPPKAKAPSAAPAHGSYIDMVKDAIINLKERNGSSRQAIQKYIQANNKLGNLSDAAFRGHVNRAISSGEEKGDFARPKGPSGPVKLAKKEAKPAAATKKSESKTEKKVTEKKTEKKTAEKKKAPATKKAAKDSPKDETKEESATETETATKAAPKKKAATSRPKKAAATTTKAAAAKPKANASKPRKTASAKPAVEEQVSRVLGKTKSGRVTKSKAPTG